MDLTLMLFRAWSLHMLAKFLAAATLIAYFSAADCAAAGEPTLPDMNHKSWTARDGAPQGVNALAQANDGVIWIGSEAGLFSFDGRTFAAFQARPGDPDLPAGPVESVLATRDGEIWVGFRASGIARISHGRVTLFTEAGKLPLRTPQHIRQSSDGAIWALNRQLTLVRFGADGIWHEEPTPLGPQGGRIYDIFIDTANTLWLEQGGRLYRRPLSQAKYFVTEAEADWVFAYVEAPDHSLWVHDVITNAPGSPPGRTQHIDPQGKVLARLPETDYAQDLVFEPDGSLVMTSFGAGLLRFPAAALTAPAPAATQVPRDRYGEKDGLSSNIVQQMLLDNDGNLWVATQRGLDRFRSARLVAFDSKNVIADPLVCAGKSGDVWIVASENGHEAFYRVSAGAKQPVPHDGQVTSLFCGPDGDTWIVATTGGWNIRAGRLTAVAPIPGAVPLDTHQLIATADHVLYASITAAPNVTGIWRYAQGSWTRLATPGAPPSSPNTVYLDSHERLWAAYPGGQIQLPLDGGRQIPSGTPGLGGVYAFLETSHGLFAGGLNGLAILRDNHFDMLTFADRLSSLGIGGLVESANGDLWLNASHGIAHVRSEDLQATLLDPRRPLKSELLTEGDFVGPPRLTPGQTTAGRDADGNLWFATLNGVFHIDPGHLNAGIHPPILSIRSIFADQESVSDGGKIDPGPQAVDIQYLGVNLTTPESVTYRYRLDGLDDAWQDAGHRTEAIYPHPRPGTYTFRVMASNGDGVWTPASSVAFKVLPHFYQTIWFLLLCVMTGLLLIGFAIAVRLRVISHTIKTHAEMQTTLAHANRLAAMGQVTASIAHEVNQPISGTIINAQTALRILSGDPPDLERVNQALTRILRDGNRAAQVVQRVRTMTKRAPATMGDVALNDAIVEVVDMARGQAVIHGISVRTELALGLPIIQGDQVQLQQVMLNLIVNAIEAISASGDETGELLIRTEAGDGGNVLVIVADSGPGLEPAAFTRLFEPFHTTKPNGLGLGLSICRSIVEAHGGQLSAHANVPHGTVFQFFVPAEQRS